MASQNSADRPGILAYSEAAVDRVIAALRADQPVALPTETVYGLAANAGSADAVAAIYRAKGRPDFNPLIVHVPNMAAARELTEFNNIAQKLAEYFWPGPLTMVLPLSDAGRSAITPAVTAGLDTIALRCPAHRAMRAVLERSGLLLAAPSANRSGGISPSEAAHVAKSLKDRIDWVLDDGRCRDGLESTIVSISDNGWQILRPGPITEQQISATIGGKSASAASAAIAPKITAPGQLASHYAPGKPVRLNAEASMPGEWLIGFGALSGDDTLSVSGDLAEAAARLYDALHRADASDARMIAIAAIPMEGIGAAINDRLRRAAA